MVGYPSTLTFDLSKKVLKKFPLLSNAVANHIDQNRLKIQVRTYHLTDPLILSRLALIELLQSIRAPISPDRSLATLSNSHATKILHHRYRGPKQHPENQLPQVCLWRPFKSPQDATNSANENRGAPQFSAAHQSNLLKIKKPSGLFLVLAQLI